jgi:hypothetical protein
MHGAGRAADARGQPAPIGPESQSIELPKNNQLVSARDYDFGRPPPIS